MDSGLLSLKWNNHGSTFFHVLSTIRRKVGLFPLGFGLIQPRMELKHDILRESVRISVFALDCMFNDTNLLKQYLETKESSKKVNIHFILINSETYLKEIKKPSLK